MKVISPANKVVMQMLNNFTKPGMKYRKLKYLVDTEVEDGILLFNLFTRELVLLTKKEFENAIENEYLRNQWFIVPEECDEKGYLDLIRTFLKSKRQKFKRITNYTIFTTTDCNARCFYCFEAGRSRITMSHETALKVAKYIKDHSKGKKVSIRWFGGEPLMNIDAIDTISEYLRAENICFDSTMVTNGYLFNKIAVDKAVKLWNLKAVQITLDGTQEVYNRVKAYVNTDGNPFEIVTENIQYLLDAGIKLSIRLNMDLYNADDLLALTKYLCERYTGYNNNLFIYAHHLFNADTPDADLHSEDEWSRRAEALARINSIIKEHNFTEKKEISSKLKIYQCMADNGRSITILPAGDIGLCEHYSDSEFIGHIDSDKFDENLIKTWAQTVPEIPKCENCFYYPECIMLKKCNTTSKCYPQYIEKQYCNTQLLMKNKYNKYLE